MLTRPLFTKSGKHVGEIYDSVHSPQFIRICEHVSTVTVAAGTNLCGESDLVLFGLCIHLDDLCTSHDIN